MTILKKMRNELVHELDKDVAKRKIPKDKIRRIVGSKDFERRYYSFLDKNSETLEDENPNHINYRDFICCALLSKKPEKERIISKLEKFLGKDNGELGYFIKEGEKIGKRLEHDPLNGLVGTLRKSGSSFYNVKDGVVELESLMNSPVSARGENSGYALSCYDPRIELNLENMINISIKDKEYPLTGLFLEPEKPELYLRAGNSLYIHENDIVAENKLKAKGFKSLPKGSKSLEKVKENGDTTKIRSFSLVYNGRELFIENLGIERYFEEYDAKGTVFYF
ncbi:MAG: hypothetical protein ACQESF_06345 [Nanobdellota archaeon]